MRTAGGGGGQRKKPAIKLDVACFGIQVLLLPLLRLQLLTRTPKALAGILRGCKCRNSKIFDLRTLEGAFDLFVLEGGETS